MNVPIFNEIHDYLIIDKIHIGKPTVLLIVDFFV